MATEFKLPELGENIHAGSVVNVLVSAGDTIEQDQPVLELETDKATIEVPSSVSGVVQEVHVKTGETVEVGQIILTVDGETNGKGDPDLKLKPEKPKEMVPDSMPEAGPTAMPPPPTQPAEPPAAPTAAPESAPPQTATVEFKLPELGENIETGTIVKVLVAGGDTIAQDQPVLEIETDKATVEVPSSVGGLIKEIHVQEGQKVQVGQVILTMETTVTAPDKVSPIPEAKPPEPAPEPKVEAEPVKTPPQPEGEAQDVTAALPAEERTPSFQLDLEPEPARSAVPAAPNVRRLAREIGVDITLVPGSGPGGRISMEDVKRFARQRSLPLGLTIPTGQVAAAPLPDFSKWGEVERVAMNNIRRKTAEHLSQAWAAIPHVTQFDKADIAELEQLRKRFAKTVEAAGAKLTVTAILLKVAAAALKAFPQFNASVDMAKNEVVYKKYYHVGVAVDTDRGLLAPVIRDVDRKNILELAVELHQVAERARNKKLTLEDMQGGTFTLTNLGGLGGTHFTPIVNSPEVAILGVARGRVEPVYRNGQFEPRMLLPLALSYDHRLIDGADGVRFLRWIVEHLEQPFLTALQGW